MYDEINGINESDFIYNLQNVKKSQKSASNAPKVLPCRKKVVLLHPFSLRRKPK